MGNEPAFIIAAARSGTKILRAVLSKSNDFVEFPYDMNYIWKYGNYNIRHDELISVDITPEIEFFIKRKFSKLAERNKGKRILEKTVSNSLRIDYVRSIFPEGKIIHLFRDGRDVAADARLCWQASALSNRIQSKTDLFKKVIDFPIRAAFPYLINYSKSYFRKAIRKSNYVDSWGPRFEGIDDAIKAFRLLEVCGMQWSKSVDNCLKDLSVLDEGNDFINVRYEELVANPVEELRRIREFLKINDFKPIERFAQKNLSEKYVGFWKDALTENQKNILLPHIENNLKRFCYI